MLADASAGQTGDEAVMRFTLTKPADKNGFKFYYYVSGDDGAKLTVSDLNVYSLYFIMHPLKNSI